MSDFEQIKLPVAHLVRSKQTSTLNIISFLINFSTVESLG